MAKKNNQKLYDKLWKINFDENKHVAGDMDLSLQHIHKTRKLKRKHMILEIGCGTGQLANALYQRGYKNITGVDVSSVAIKHGQKHFSQVPFKIMDAETLKFPDQTFDICLSFDLFEHLHNQSKHLAEVYRILKPGGYYLFQTPNIISNAPIETWQRKSFKWREYHPGLHFSWTLKQTLKQAKFKNIAFNKISPISDYKLQKMIPPFRFIFSHIPWQQLPISLQVGFYVIAQK